MARIISVYNFKGGVGKTTTSYNLSLLWRRSHRVLVIDCDPQCNLTRTFTHDSTKQSSLYDLLTAKIHSHDLRFYPLKLTSDLHLIPGDYRITELESNSRFIEFGLGLTRDLLREVGRPYDLVVLDCPSYFGKTVKYFLGNTDHLLIPAIPDTFSIQGIVELLRQLKPIEKFNAMTILGIFFIRYRANLKHHQRIRALARRIFGRSFIDTPIRNTIRVSEAMDRRSLAPEESQSMVFKDFERLSLRLLEKMGTLNPISSTGRSTAQYAGQRKGLAG